MTKAIRILDDRIFRTVQTPSYQIFVCRTSQVLRFERAGANLDTCTRRTSGVSPPFLSHRSARSQPPCSCPGSHR